MKFFAALSYKKARKPPSQLDLCPLAAIEPYAGKERADDLVGQNGDPRAVEPERGEVHQNEGEPGAQDADGEQ